MLLILLLRVLLLIADKNLFKSSSWTAFQVYNDFHSKVLNFYPVQFNQIPINIGEKYDTETNSFQPLIAGLYWFLFDTFTNVVGNINYTLRDVITGDKAFIFVSEFKMGVIAQNYLGSVQPESRLQMFSQCPYYVWEQSMIGMSWGGFNIDNLSPSSPVAFSVLKHSSLLGNFAVSPPRSPFQFDVVFINSGQCWNEALHTFTAPVNGIYIFSFSTITTISNLEVILIINGKQSVPSHFCRMITYFVDGEVLTICCSIVLLLTGGDSVYISWNFRPQIDRYEQASFKGFLYAPPNNMSVVWSAAISRPSKLSVDDQRDITLTDVIINVGGVFRGNDTSKVIIPINGVYYVTFRALQPINVTAALFVNRRKHMEIISVGYFMHTLTLERSFLLHLTTGNSLSLRLIALSNKQTDTYIIQWLFTGLLVVQS